MSRTKQPLPESTYRIGAVSRLTGIAADTLRVWERRYRLVEPRRSPKGNRVYTRDDVTRLAFIKRLVDAGHAIGTVAELSLEQLQARLAAEGGRAATVRPGLAKVCRVAILGDALPIRLAAGGAPEGIEVVASQRDAGRFLEQISAARPEVLVLEYPTLHEETVAEVQRLLARSGAARAVIVYGFGRQDLVSRLDTLRTVPVRAPVDPGSLRRWCVAAGLAQAPAGPGIEETLAQPLPATRFLSEELARVAVASTTVKCECPHHLADLISGLSAFEQYSAECENRSPDDAALHAYLHATTAKARSLMEEALARVLEAERTGQ
jgi:DNA-binding transcriptional MerR regulator